MEIDADKGKGEVLITRLIYKIKNNHSRPCLQNIHHHLNRGNYKIEMAELEKIIGGMISSDKIRDVGKSGAESYRVTTSNDKPLEVTSENVDVVEDDDKDVVASSFEPFIDELDEKFDSIMNRIKSELKHELNFNSAKLNRKNDDDDIIIILKDQVDFLKKELESKNTIIQMLLKDNNTTKLLDIHTSKSNNNIVEDHNINTSSKEINEVSIQANSNEKKDKENSQVQKKKNNKRSTVILGDSLLKGVEQHRVKISLKNNENVYVKSFSGATIEHMKSHVIPSKSFENDLVILHCGTNSLRENKLAERIARDIIELAHDMKTDNNEIMISGIVTRNDKWNAKGEQVNEYLTSLCSLHNYNYINNSNIKKHHLNFSGLHLNDQGNNILGRNLVDAISL